MIPTLLQLPEGFTSGQMIRRDGVALWQSVARTATPNRKKRASAAHSIATTTQTGDLIQAKSARATASAKARRAAEILEFLRFLPKTFRICTK